MLIGAMNHPASEITEEIQWMSEMGLDFLDLTLEPPRAAPWQVDPSKLRAALARHRLGVIGHTAYYLPIANAFEEIRRTAVEQCRKCLDIFSQAGARWMNVHPDSHSPLHSKKFFMDKNLQSLEELLAHGRRVGVGIMVENIPGDDFNSAADLGVLLEAFPELGLHLDIGHCNLCPIPNNAETILNTYGKRLRHVHLHDNKGGRDDLHLPLGAGTIDVPRIIRALKGCGYDGTITLEVFSPNRHYLEYSRDLLRRMWDTGDDSLAPKEKAK